MARKKIVFMNKKTGDIRIVRTKLEGHLLGNGWVQLEFTKNAAGEDVMRVKYDEFTVDIIPSGEREVTEGDGNRDSK